MNVINYVTWDSVYIIKTVSAEKRTSWQISWKM